MRNKRESPFEFTNYIFITPSLEVINDLVGPIVSYISIVFNIIIIVVLSTKQLRNPSSILMQGLALSDAFVAVFSYGLEPFLVGTYIRNLEVTVIHYPECKIHNYKNILVDMFHLISVYMTTALGVQKAAAIRWPMWSFTNLNRVMMCIVCTVIYLVPLVLHVPRFLLPDFKRGQYSKEQCHIAARSNGLLTYSFNHYSTIIASLLFAASFVMILSSAYIIWSLSKHRSANVNESEALHNIRKRSSKLVAAVTVTFLVVELPRIVVFGIIQFFSRKDENSSQLLVDQSTQIVMSFYDVFDIREGNIESFRNIKLFIDITRFLVVIACLSNFLIYVAMSKAIRDVIIKKAPFCYLSRIVHPSASHHTSEG